MPRVLELTESVTNNEYTRLHNLTTIYGTLLENRLIILVTRVFDSVGVFEQGSTKGRC